MCKSFCYYSLVLEEVVADEERSQVAREVLVASDGVSGARKGQSVEALPEDWEVVVEEILERPVVGRRLVVRRREPERVVQRRLAGASILWVASEARADLK